MKTWFHFTLILSASLVANSAMKYEAIAAPITPPGSQQDRRQKQSDDKQKQQEEETKQSKEKETEKTDKESDDQKKQESSDQGRQRGNAANNTQQNQDNAAEAAQQNRSRGQRSQRNMRQSNSRRNRSAGDASESTADSQSRLKTDASQSSRGEPAEAETPTFLISPAATRSIQIPGRAYSRMTEVRLVQGNQVSKELQATVQRTRSGATIELTATDRAELANFTMQGKINGRWTTLPLQLTVDKREAVIGSGQRVEVHPREVITMPDGSRVVIGGEKIVEDSGGSNPSNGNGQPMGTPSVTSWSPEKFGTVGGTLTINGANFGDDIQVKIGNVTLPVAQRTTTQVTVNLPESSDECPPAELRVVREDGFIVLTCEPRYFVRGDKPIHHIADTGSHDYINSYMLARLSRWVYNDYHGVSSWTSFQSQFEDLALAMGATDVQFVKGGSGPGDTELAIVANPEMIVVVFRGSESPISEENGYQDWINTNADVDEKPMNSWQPGAWVHEGIYNAYHDVHSTLKGKLDSLRDNGQPVILTGHSLGGALATMAAYRLNLGNTPVRAVYTYGSPRVGNVEWAKAYDNAGLQSKTQRWVNRQDFAPRYPIASEWRHVGLTNNIHMDGSIELNGEEVSAVLTPNTGDHNMDIYCNEILGQLSNSQKNKISAAAQ